MKYVDWVERVLRATLDAVDSATNSDTSMQGIIERLGLDLDERSEPLHDALSDLDRMGLVDFQTVWHIAVEYEARKTRTVSLRTCWPQFQEIWLDPQAEAFLAKLCELSERQDDHWAHLDMVDGDAVLAAVDTAANAGDSMALINVLAAKGLVDKSGIRLGSFQVFPTYGGIVRATEKAATEGQETVRQLLEDWETTNVDFKREVHLGTKDDRAEVARDVLALANTQVTGKRYLVIGFDPKTHAFTTSVDPGITQDRMENVLNELTEPPVTVAYKTFSWVDGTGDVGLLEVQRDRTRVPYRARREFGGNRRRIQEGDVFVRHGTHVTEASEAEIADLESEATFAKAAIET